MELHGTNDIVEAVAVDLQAGKRADLVLVDGDPTRNISDVRKVALVLKEGKAYYPSEVYEELGIKPFAEPVRAVAATAPSL